MEDASLLRQINYEIETFKTKNIQVVPGLYYNQYELVNTTYFYYNSKFQSGTIDDEGDRKYFYNITKNPCKVFTKAVDFDTKNIRLLTVGGGDPLKTWFMERDLKYWMRDINFGKTLNHLFAYLPVFGSYVLKVIDGVPYYVDLRNFIVDQSADTLDDSNYITEIHNLTPTSFRKIAKQMGWSDEDVKTTIEEFHKMKNTSHIRLYERYGEVPRVTDEGKQVWEYRRTFLADVGVDELDNYGQIKAQHTGVTLSSEIWNKKHPYWEFHAEKMAGRWLGIGVVESLFEAQIRQNELSNLQSKTTYWAALRIFQTRDGAINRNLLSDVRNGEIINSDSEITQIDMSDRNLAFFNDEHQKWMRNRDEMTFSYDVVQGERLPAGTPLGSAQLAVNQTLSYFETIQENIALAVKEMIYEVIIPQFEKENNNKEHTLRLIGQDLDQYIEMVQNELTFKEVVRIATKPNGYIVSEQERNAITAGVSAAIKQKKEKVLTVPVNFYKDVKYDVDIDITGESVDTRVRGATLFAILQAIANDPTMTTDPVKRKFLFTMGEDGGLNMADYLDAQPKTPEAMVPQDKRSNGGGVSSPANIASGGSPTTTV
jgi:hypothetical protein